MDLRSWKPSNQKYGVAICSYKGRNERCLSLVVGETVHILEEYGSSDGWYRGESITKKTGFGIFPKRLIHIKSCHVSNKGQYETVTPVEDHMVQELTFGLREWFQTWKTTYLSQGYCSMLEDVTKTMKELIVLRGRLVNNTLSVDQASSLREEIATLVDWVNGQLGMDLIPRKNGQEMDPDQSSIVELHRVHAQGLQRLQSKKKTRNRLPTESHRTEESHINNILVRYKSSQCNIGDDSVIYMSIYSAKEEKFISEQYEIKLNKNGFPVDIEKSDNLNALFTDLSSDDLNKNLYLVVRIYRYGRMLLDHKDHKKPMTCPYRRPWGVGVLAVKEIEDYIDIVDDLSEKNVKVVNMVCCADDNTFAEYHEHLIKRYNQTSSSSKLAVSTSGQDKTSVGLHVAVRIIPGELKKAQTDHPLLFSKGVDVIQKMDFSDIINPGEVRNDVYFELQEGDFDRDGKKAQKNVEVKISVLDKNGRPIPKCISYGCGEKLVDNFRSSVLYHCNGPRWNESVRVSIPMEKFPGSNVLLEVSHCSTKTSKAEKKLCGFAFMQLTNAEDIVIKDAMHSLCVYKCEDSGKIKFDKYKSLPFLVDDFGDPRQSAFIMKSLPYTRSGKESLQISTKLVSTKFTQTSELLGILKWRDSKHQLEKNLDRMMILQGGEIMKFLQDILDALFEMLAEGSAAPYYTKVFHALIFILNLLLDSRFENFVPVLDSYLKETFTSPLVHTHLTSCFALGIQQAVEGEHFPVAMSLKVLDFLVRFIVRSRELESMNPLSPTRSRSEYEVQISELFKSFGLLLSCKDQKLKISQMALLSNLQKSFKTFVIVMSKRHLAEHVKDIISKLPALKDLSEDVARNKMEFIREIVNSEFFLEDESRCVLLPLCLFHVKLCLTEKMLLPLVTGTLGDILDKLFTLKQTKKNMMDDIETVASTMFPVIVDTTLTMSDKIIPQAYGTCSVVPSLMSPQQEMQSTADFDSEEEESHVKKGKRERRRTLTGIALFASKPRPPSCTLQREPVIIKTPDSTPARPLDIGEMVKKKMAVASMEDMGLSGEMISCVAELLRLMEDKHYSIILKPQQVPLKAFFVKVLLTFQELIKEEIFPLGWTVMRMVINNALFTATEYFSAALREHFLNKEVFDQQLWSHYFNLAVSFVTQPSLQLERYSEAKKQKIKNRYQDMRISMGQQIQTLWENLGNNRRHFIPSLIGPFLKVTLVPEEELRKATIPIFYDMMESETKSSGNFQLVENEMIEKLDEYITMERLGDREYMNLFSSILLDKVQREPELEKNGRQFVLSVTDLLERLLDYRQVCDGDEHRDQRKLCTFNILNFYKDNTNREEMYVRYIKKLYDLHFTSKHYVEAGLTLKLYSQLLQWKDRSRPEELGYPTQPEWERKERIYLQIIDCFDKGRVWEYGIPLCKELAEVYEKRLDYRKLSKILERQAKFFSNILDGFEVLEEGMDRPVFYPRQEPTYFRVAYYGQNFPPFVRNKTFIYRGNECLKLQDIINQMKQEFPAATILQFKTVMDKEKMHGDAQYIQIGSVRPRPDDRKEFVYNPDCANEIKNFYTSNDVNTFQFDRSFHRGERDSNNEFKTLCTERTVMHTNYKFPGILQWYEVVSMETITLSPVCTANEAVRSACKELEKEIDKTQKEHSIDACKSLSMKLNGMISASVQGGIPKYQEAFFVPEYVRTHPAEEDRVRELRELLNEQVKLLEKGLHLMKTMDKVHGTGLSDMLRSLNDILKEIKESLGLRATVDRSSSMLSVSSREALRRDSGVESMAVDFRPGTPGSGSVHSSGSNRSSGVSADALSQDDELAESPTDGFTPLFQQMPSRDSKGASSSAEKRILRPFSMFIKSNKPQTQSTWYDLQQQQKMSGSDPNLHQMSAKSPPHDTNVKRVPSDIQRPTRPPVKPPKPTVSTTGSIPERPEPPPKRKDSRTNIQVLKKPPASPVTAQPPLQQTEPRTQDHVPPLPPRRGSTKQQNGLSFTPLTESHPHNSSTDQDAPPPIPNRQSVKAPRPSLRTSFTGKDEHTNL